MTHCEKIMLLADATFFMSFFRIFPRERTIFKIFLFVMPYPFPDVHRLRISFIRIRINDFVISVSVLLSVHNLAIFVFIDRLFTDDQSGVF